MIAGTLAHCAVLEPEEFFDRYVVTPSDAPRKPTEAQRNAKKPSPETIESIAWWDAFYQRNIGKEIITQEQSDTAWKQRDSVLTIPDVAEALASGMPEVSAFWTDEETGILCKCRPDWVHPCDDGSVILVDLKTTTDASPREFSRSIAKWRYHVQAAWYADGYAKASGLTVRGFVFAAVETDFPHLPAAYMLDDDSIDQGRTDYRRNLETYAECLACGIWPGYEKEIQLTRIPNWAFDQDEELSIGYV
jgi:exodeoxyribonuclease VIII